MADYEVIAFFLHEPQEIANHAETLGKKFSFSVRYEQLPRIETGINSLLNEKTILCLFSRDILSFKKLLKYIYVIKKPALLTSSDYSTDAFDSLQLPVGYLQENKENVMWANFFQHRNSAATIELLLPNETDANIKAMVKGNTAFMENIFLKSGATYKKTPFPTNFEKTLKLTFKTQKKSLIFLMRPFRIFSFYTPYPLRLYKRWGHTPILIIPRDDKLYIPCH